MPHRAVSGYGGIHTMRTTAFTKSAAAITLAALATFGIAACSSGGSSNASDTKSSNSGSSSSKPKASSTPKAGLATKVQCAELETKLSSSEKGLEDAMTNVSSASDVQAAIPKLQAFQQDLNTQVGKITDPALKQAAGKFNTDYGTMISTITKMLNDVSSNNAADAQTQETALQSQETAIQSDADALQKVCG